jgi:hypothetical protein
MAAVGYGVGGQGRTFNRPAPRDLLETQGSAVGGQGSGIGLKPTFSLRRGEASRLLAPYALHLVPVKQGTTATDN